MIRQGRITGNSGFTIVELMIASTVFATVLLVVTFAVLQIGRTYYKGITTTRTQEATRAVVDELSQAIQFGSGEPYVNLSGGVVCAGSKRFSFVLNQQVTGGTAPGDHALMMEQVDACDGQVRDMSAGREMLNTRMRLASFDVQRVVDSEDDDDEVPVIGARLYRITVRVVSGDNDLLEDRSGNGILDSCRAERAGGQFCAVSELSTVVQRRL